MGEHNFDEIYEEFKDLVFNLSLNYIPNYQDAQEVAQDVFVSIHKSLDTFNHQSELKTWIYRITINKCLDRIKFNNRKKRFYMLSTLFGDNSIEKAFHFNHPGIQLEQKESVEFIFKLIDKLPHNQRTALILNKIEKLKQAEISEIMDLNIKAVESLIHRAKTFLKKRLDENKG